MTTSRCTAVIRPVCESRREGSNCGSAQPALGLTLVILLAASCGRSTPLAAGSDVHAQSVNGFVDAMSSAYRMITIAVFVLTVPVAIALRTEANSDTRDDAAARKRVIRPS